MPAFSLTATVNRFKGAEWSKEMQTRMEQVMIGAANAFYVAATRRIPVRTGFLQGSFSGILDAVNALGEGAKPIAGLRNSGLKNENRSLRDKVVPLANKVERLRTAQAKRLRLLKQLRIQQEARTAQIAAIYEDYRKRVAGIRNTNVLKAVKYERNLALQAIKTEAIEERRKRLSIITATKRAEGTLNKGVAQLDRALGVKSKPTNVDVLNHYQRRIEAQVIKSESVAFRAIKRISADFRNNVISLDVYEKRITTARGRLSSKTARQIQLENKRDSVITRIAKRLNQDKLQKLRARLFKKNLRRAEKSGVFGGNARSAAAKETAQNLTEKLTQVLRNKSRNKFLQVLQESQTKQGFELLQNLQEKLDKRGRNASRRNELVRVRTAKGTHTIRGLNADGTFNLQAGDTAISRLNQRDIEGRPIGGQFAEFYYPNLGRAGRILKTQRSGRRFTTPPAAIFSREVDQGASTVGSVFSTLAEARKAAGLDVSSRINDLASIGKNLPVRYFFNFNNYIKYLAVNDIKQGWAAFKAGITAFEQFLFANAMQAVPDLDVFTAKSNIAQRGTTVTRSG